LLHFHDLLYDAVSTSDYTVSNGMISA